MDICVKLSTYLYSQMIRLKNGGIGLRLDKKNVCKIGRKLLPDKYNHTRHNKVKFRMHMYKQSVKLSMKLIQMMKYQLNFQQSSIFNRDVKFCVSYD